MYRSPCRSETHTVQSHVNSTVNYIGLFEGNVFRDVVADGRF